MAQTLGNKPGGQAGAFGQASAASAAEDSVAAAAHAALREGEVVVARTDSPIPIECMPLSPLPSPIAFRRTHRCRRLHMHSHTVNEVECSIPGFPLGLPFPSELQINPIGSLFEGTEALTGN